jgi:hypothetical protein
VGWDGDLAYGAAMAKATVVRNTVEDPDYVEMNCYMYGLKVLAAVVGGAVGGWAAAEGKTSVAVGVGVGTLAAAFVPNCFATIGYHERTPRPRPTLRPTVREESIRRPSPRDDDSEDADGGAPDATPSPMRQPPATNQARDREGP